MPAEPRDPSGVARPVASGRVEAAGNNSGVVVGETKTTASTGEDSYKTEFVKVYQDAGVVGAAMLTLIVLCLLLGMFCTRLIKMYTALTTSRDNLENTRTLAVEKLATSLIVLRSEVTASLAELRREHDNHTTRLEAVTQQVSTNGTLAAPVVALVQATHEIVLRMEKESATDRQRKLDRLEKLFRNNGEMPGEGS